MDLSDYIKQQLKAGYDINTIRYYLQQYGYSVQDIEKAVQSAYAPPKPPIKLPWKIIIPAISVILILTITFSFIALKPAPERPLKLLDLELEPVSDVGSIGDEYEFKIKLFNFGAKPRFDVYLTHELLDSVGNVLQTKEETVAVETRSEKITSFDLPIELFPGKYSIKTVAKYEGLIATAQIDFQAELFKECPDSCDDEDPCTKDICDRRTKFECYHVAVPNCIPEPVKPNITEPVENITENVTVDVTEEPENITVPEEMSPEEIEEALDETVPPEESVELPSAPERELNPQEKIAQIQREAASDPDQARQRCENELEEEADKEYCFEVVASESQSSEYCELIDDVERKDRCYSDYALNTLDFSVCEKIINDDLKESCNEFAELAG